MNLRRIIKEELLKEQLLCKLISPLGSGKGRYISNDEALNLITRIEYSAKGEIKDPKKLMMFKKSMEQFKQDINNIDTNNDTVNTNLHKLRDLIGCYGLSNTDNANPKDFDF
jgi:hypothetical protein